MQFFLSTYYLILWNGLIIVEVRLELRYVERYKERKQYECLEEIHKEEIIDHLAKLVVSDEKDEAAIINNVLDLMKTPFDRPYKFSLIFTYEEQVKFVKIINNIKNNALVT